MSRIIREMTPGDLPASSVLRATTRENAMAAEVIARDYGITTEGLTAAMAGGDVKAWLFQQGHGEIWLLAGPDPARRAHGFYRKHSWRPNGRMVEDDQVLTLSRPE